MKYGHDTLQNVHYTPKLEDWCVFAISYEPFDTKLGCPRNLEEQMDQNALQNCIPFQYKNHATHCLEKSCRHLTSWQIFDIFDWFLCNIFSYVVCVYGREPLVSHFYAGSTDLLQPSAYSTVTTLPRNLYESAAELLQNVFRTAAELLQNCYRTAK